VFVPLLVGTYPPGVIRFLHTFVEVSHFVIVGVDIFNSLNEKEMENTTQATNAACDWAKDVAALIASMLFAFYSPRYLKHIGFSVYSEQFCSDGRSWRAHLVVAAARENGARKKQGQ
jgi:hypothetical protein